MQVSRFYVNKTTPMNPIHLYGVSMTKGRVGSLKRRIKNVKHGHQRTPQSYPLNHPPPRKCQLSPKRTLSPLFTSHMPPSSNSMTQHWQPSAHLKAPTLTFPPNSQSPPLCSSLNEELKAEKEGRRKDDVCACLAECELRFLKAF
ncbi:hypothetical protein AN958_12330 [Leucoagaricus sp. SymC.cos]|nr:hypothetical protein AN958_12330 [Leucoagaricus sp. SymC.cos]